ncbi:MAG: acetylxylan esterase [Planctomycetes bacterium]|nr:acetylxylan esterase [Planctomycetota bacterium]
MKKLPRTTLLKNSEWSPETLWRDVDPRAEDLRLQILSSFGREGVTVRELTYHSHEWEGEPVVAYGFLSVPEGEGRFPGVLHIHGGGQTASLEHTVFWARSGFAALSFDWTGPAAGREKTTRFGNASLDKYRVEPDPRHSHLYHGVWIARRGLTLLEREPGVDPSRLGIYGISWGGFLNWLVNGCDARVRAAVPIYGCGGTLKRGSRCGPEFDPESQTQRAWNFCYNPFVYAESQNGPVLFLNGTNDFFGWMETAEELYSILPRRHSLCFSPHFDHHLDDGVSRNLLAWMEAHLRRGMPWPALPAVEWVAGRKFHARIVPDRPEDVEAVQAFYALHQAPPPCLFWCPASTRKWRNRWNAALPQLPERIPCSLYATVRYRSGISISSIPLTFTASEPGHGDEWEAGVSSLIDDFSGGIGHWFLHSLGTEPFPETLKLKLVEGPSGGPAIQIEPVSRRDESFTWTLATRKIADPRWAARGRTGLYLLLRVHCGCPLRVRLTRRYGLADAASFTALVECAEERWSEVELSPENFIGPEEVRLDSFDEAVFLEISGTSPTASPPALARVTWF